ncbi:NYN domain-containing protein [Thioclava sp. FR2]|uniref:NYN domain-containing protein n=1 Tax=Thioclava sp. FR2 TaxID=3445780 RepID=UPI003EBDAA8A
MTQRIFILVDGDNISASHARTLLTLGSQLGRVDVARCYLNAQKNSPWLSEPEFRAIHAGSGKNAADLLLAIDAMELAQLTESAQFILASSDADFSHLAHRLRERGHGVHGVGEAKAPAAFRRACSQFKEVGAPPKQVVEKAPTPANAPAPSAFDLKIRDVIAQHSENGKGMLITTLSGKMRQLHQEAISTRPQKTWRKYFAENPHLYALDPKGPEAHVRFLWSGFNQAVNRAV